MKNGFNFVRLFDENKLNIVFLCCCLNTYRLRILRGLGEKKVVYFCTDSLSGFTSQDIRHRRGCTFKLIFQEVEAHDL